MRFTELLNEVKMSPSALEQWAKSPEADGIRAGFEAEVVFNNVLEDSRGDPEMDMDYDEKMYSASDIRDFFEDVNSSGAISRVIDELEDAYQDANAERASSWVDEEFDSRLEKDFESYWDDNSEAFIDEAMDAHGWDSSGPREDEDETQEQWDAAREELEPAALEKAKDDYREEHEDSIREELYDEYYSNQQLDFDDFLYDHLGGSYASDVYQNYDRWLDWPHWTHGQEEGYDQEVAAGLARQMKQVVDMPFIAGSGYHSAARSDNRWIIESDSSLEADNPGEDMPAEIVSPPMPLNTCLDKMQTLFQWLLKQDAYTNDSTGCHIGVSVPFQKGDNVDFVKLILFAGDDVVLSDFGRTANHYCKSALQKVKERFQGQKMTEGNLQAVLDLMRQNLLELAKRYMPKDFGKYTSINIKRDAAYVEFRSPGGEDYLKDFAKMRNTVLRFARALSIANNPAAERNEYAKKLYKLITQNSKQDPSNAPLAYLSTFMSGSMTQENLKHLLQQSQWARGTSKTKSSDMKVTSDRSPSNMWGIFDRNDGGHLSTVRGMLADVQQRMSEYPYPHLLEASPMYWWQVKKNDTGELLGTILAADMADATKLLHRKYGIEYTMSIYPMDQQARVTTEQERVRR